MFALAIAASLSSSAAAGPPRISDDRELKEIDLSSWNCLERPEGSARTPDGAERNRLKNRTPVDLGGMKFNELDTVRFLQSFVAFETLTKNKRRKDLSPAERQQLDPLEQQLVQFTGYLVLAYCGPPETTNCASVDFHDWHLEVFERPSDHPPQPGDPTPIICEITPRTQNAIYRDHVRIQELTAFFRRADLSYEATGHKARRIRVTGYRLWDDEHNGRADVGETIRTVGANKYHNPWRATAWEIHPVIRIEPLDGAAPQTLPAVLSPAQTAAPLRQMSPPPKVETITTPTSSPAVPSPAGAASPTPPPKAADKLVTLTQPVRIRIPYGETVLPRGLRLPVKAADAQTVTIEYMGANYPIPISSTDWR